MNCPTCGAPNVILHKDIWECGWCGDSGPIPRRILEQHKAGGVVAGGRCHCAVGRPDDHGVGSGAAARAKGRKIPCMKSHPLPSFSGSYRKRPVERNVGRQGGAGRQRPYFLPLSGAGQRFSRQQRYQQQCDHRKGRSHKDAAVPAGGSADR